MQSYYWVLTAYKKSHTGNRLLQNEWPWPLFRGHNRRIKVMSTIASHSALNISETARDRGLGSKGPPTGNGLWGIKWSRDRWRLVTRKVKLMTTSLCLRENMLRCYLATCTCYEAVRSVIVAIAWLLVTFLLISMCDIIIKSVTN